MSDEIMLVFGEDGVAREYDDAWDITIHCESEEEQKAVLEKLNNSNQEPQELSKNSPKLDKENGDLQPTCNQLATDTISRQAAIEETWKEPSYADPLNVLTEMRDRLRALPSAQPERKKGKWQITDAYPHNVYCSECHTRFAQTHWAVWEDGSLPRNFCPNCGADLREDQDE